MARPETPIEMRISLASAYAALEYWLSNVVFQEQIKIEAVTYGDRDGFTVKFDRQILQEKDHG